MWVSTSEHVNVCAGMCALTAHPPSRSLHPGLGAGASTPVAPATKGASCHRVIPGVAGNAQPRTHPTAVSEPAEKVSAILCPHNAEDDFSLSRESNSPGHIAPGDGAGQGAPAVQAMGSSDIHGKMLSQGLSKTRDAGLPGTSVSTQGYLRPRLHTWLPGAVPPSPRGAAWDSVSIKMLLSSRIGARNVDTA